jgi:hypothetical protein
VLLLAIPATASAAGSNYPSANAVRGFDGGAAGWDSSTSTEGICLSPLLCTSGTSVLVTGSADYDNVVLSAVTGNGGGSNGNGGKGKGDGGGRKGGGSFNSQRLEELLRGATPGTAKLDEGKRLLMRVNCPRKVGRQCRTTVQGLLKKGRPATNRRSVRLRSGKSKLVALKVKPKARERVARRKRILVRQKVHAGKATATIFKNRLLLRR